MLPREGKARRAGCCHRLMVQHPGDRLSRKRDTFNRAAVPDSDDFPLIVEPDSMAEGGIKHVVLDHHHGEDCRGQRGFRQCSKNDGSAG